MSMSVLDVTAETFNAEVVESSSSTPVLLEFWAQWASACRFTAPVLELISIQYGDKIKVTKANLDEMHEISTELEVFTAPVILVFVGGSVAKRIDGAMPFDLIVNELAEFL